jgi:signal transduction histidine kinase/CheY-like chemotaxis protein
VQPTSHAEKESSRYLSAASFPLDIEDGPPANPEPSRDLTLNALVQHGTHMMNCDRAFLSLIDNRSQFICAEMTRSQPLGCQDPEQPLLLGIARIALDWGVCPYTISVFHGHNPAGGLLDNPYIEATEKYFCIKDFRQVPSFAVRPFVAGYPHMVSYIEVPLKSINGQILGSYCLVDNKLRDFLDPIALATIREVTSSISSYLDLKRVEGSRTRSERMMDGLRQFIDSERHTPSVENGAIGASGPQTGPFDLDLFSHTSQTSPNPLADKNIEHDWPLDVNSHENGSSGQTDTSFQVQVGSLSLTSEAPSTNTRGSTTSLSGVKVFTSPSKPTHRNHENASSTAAPRQQRVPHERVRSDLSTQVSDLFSKATKMIGYAMNLDGLLFLDAFTPGTQYRSGLSSLSPVDEHLHTHEDNILVRPLTKYLGDDATDEQLVQLPKQSLIQRLTLRYPQGHVFAVDEHGVLDYGSDHSSDVDQHSNDRSTTSNEWADLFKCVPKARYVIFLPLWHYQRESCFATCLAWVSETRKPLDSGDINSLTAFGNSLMAEILRLEALTKTRSKSDFVSTISHELRSPLHGIMATVELMQESTKDSHLLSMLGMIDSCGSTLLDTFNHLLEFSKINSRASDSKNVITDQSKHRLGNARARGVAVDLSSLVDDVLETVSLGHLKMDSGLRGEHQDPLTGPMKTTPSKLVMVTTNIERNFNWFMPVDRGAWKRVLMNIFSNALKYTKEGHIDVNLSVLEKVDNGPRYISLSVTDTGIGMSREFLKYHLFTPFMQENDLTPGTGLGLSLSKSIVESLNGNIFVESRQDEGTCVTVSIPYDQEPETIDTTKIEDTFVPQNRMRGLSLGLLSIASREIPTTEPTPHIVPPSTVLQRSIRNICEGKFGMTVIDVSTGAIPDIDILLLDTYTLTSIDELNVKALLHTLFSQRMPPVMITLGNSVTGLEHISKVGFSSPITAKRLWSAFLEALDKTDARKTTSSVPSPGLAIQEIQIDPPPTMDLWIEPTSPFSPKEHTVHSPQSPLPQASPKEHTVHFPQSPLPQATPRMEEETLKISIPKPKPPSQQVTTPNPATISAIPCRFKRFLLVDDNAINLKILVAFAKRLNRPFATATDGAEAVHLYQKAVEEKNPFDCLFMDISMPIMDGFQAVATIRRFEKEQQNNIHIPNNFGTATTPPTVERSYIFALTGLGSEQARSSARDSGFDGFLLKPVKFQDILPLLRPI